MTTRQLAVDFGTSHTVAAVRSADGQIRPVLFDSSPLLPSAVYAEPGTGTLRAGNDAARMATLDPAGVEPNPKLRVDDGTVLLGGQEVPVLDLYTAVLRRVHTEVFRGDAPAPASTVLTHPATWGPVRRELLRTAAGRAGLGTVELVAEPVAAAMGHAHRTTGDRPVVVFDLGAGTLDVAVVGAVPAAGAAFGAVGVRSTGGLPLGGLDLDEDVVAILRDLTAGRLTDEQWHHLSRPSGPEQYRARHALRTTAREVKEALTGSSWAHAHVPGLDAGLHVTREQFEARIAPRLAAAVEETVRVIAAAGVPPDACHLLLVGGAAQVPLVATMLMRRLGIAAHVAEHPQLAVSEGALHHLAAAPGPAHLDRALEPSPGPRSVLDPDRTAAPDRSPAGPAPDRPRQLAGALLRRLTGGRTTPSPARPTAGPDDETATTLQDLLSQYGLDARIIAASRGPSVTRYDLRLGPGIDAAFITDLGRTMAYAVRSPRVTVRQFPDDPRIVGLEVHHPRPDAVTLEEVLGSQAAGSDPHPLLMAVGKAHDGRHVLVNLADLRHLLIGGAQPRRLPSLLHVPLASVLSRATPDQVRLVLIAGGRRDMTRYTGVPHLALPVVADPLQAGDALAWAARETGARRGDPAPRPYLLVMIAELADVPWSRQAELATRRITDSGPDSGVHLVMATGRPGAPTVIDAFREAVPSRLTFATGTAGDSRRCLGHPGAERLTGLGDALLLTPGSAEPLHVQTVVPVPDAQLDQIVRRVATGPQ